MDRDIARDSEQTVERENESLTSHVKPRDPLSISALHDADWDERPRTSEAGPSSDAPLQTSRRPSSLDEFFDFGALKILLILIALTVGMTLVLKFLI